MRRVAGFGVLLFVAGFLLWSWAGDLEPPGPPGPTMVTLEELGAKQDGPVDVCFDNVGRFVVCGDGAVKDNLTGLFWLENANCFGTLNWASANIAAAQLADGQCGLTDGSSPGDWRLPTDAEWQVIIDQAAANGCVFPGPFVPNTFGTGCWSEGDPFAGVEVGNYWSSSTSITNPVNARFANLNQGRFFGTSKTGFFYVWPVRAGP